ncbi:MAG: hypothetical protein H7Z10_14865, partial [Gemmatimonadaceae bacterium]|nr:hypothetical protein [Acetobacteraceae bacterium]
MFNAASLLGSFLQQRSAPSAGHRLGNAMDQGSHQAGSLSGLLSNFGGGGGALSGLMGAFSGQGRDADADMQRFKDQARSAVTSPGQAIAGNNPLAIGGLGALAGTLLGGGRGALAGNLLGGGGGAVGGGLLGTLGRLGFEALRRGALAAP